MNEPIPSHPVLAGQIYRRLDGSPSRAIPEIERNATDYRALVNRKWYAFEWKSSRALLGEDTRPSGRSPEFHYPFWMRVGSDRFLLLSTHQELVDAYLIDCGLHKTVVRPRIDVPGIVASLISPERSRAYRLGVVYASANGFGRALRTVSFFGADLAAADLFVSLLDRLAPYRITLRTARGDQEVVSVGSAGELSFLYRGKIFLESVDEALRYIKHEQCIHWE